MQIPKTLSKVLCVNAHSVHQTCTWSFWAVIELLHIYKELHKTQISSPLRRIIIHKAYLDGLCRLAFDLMRNGGGLVHLGTPTQTVLLSKWDTTADEREAKRAPVTTLRGMISVFGLCSLCLWSAQPHLTATVCAWRSAARRVCAQMTGDDG